MTIQSYIPWFIFVLAAAVSGVLLSVLLRRHARWGLDAKSADASQRWNPTSKPPLGGIVFFSVFMVLALVWIWTGGKEWTTISLLMMVGAAVAFATGLWDDLRRLTPWPKLVGQFLAAAFLAAAVHFTYGPLLWWYYPVIIVFTVGLMNSVNMLDNMDGVASIACMAPLIWYSYASPLSAFAYALAGALIVFIWFNRHPSRVYMGDSGSLLLGYVLSMFVVFAGVYQGSALDWIPVLDVLCLLAIPLSDSLLVTVNRLRHGKSPMQGGRDHSTHNLVYLGFSEQMVAFIFVLLVIAELMLRFYSQIWFLQQTLDAENQGSWWKGLLPGFIFLGVLLIAVFVISRRNLKAGRYSY